MFSLRVEFDPGPWKEGLRRLRAAVDDELEAALRGVGEVVVSAAKADHPYQDRTRDLTRTTRAYAPRGRFSQGSLRVEVVATQPYASHVMRRKGDWLEAAYNRQRGRIENDVENALRRAVDKAGLR